MSIKRIFLIILVSLLLASPSWAVHYVSNSGSANWATCTVSGSPCSLATANTNIAGTSGNNIVVLLDGTYTTTAINPANNTGTATYPLTYISQYRYDASGSQFGVIFSGLTTAVNLYDGEDYVTIDGLRVINPGSRWLTAAYLNSADQCDYLTVQYCKFDGVTGSSFAYTLFYIWKGLQQRFLYNYFDSGDVSEDACYQWDMIGMKYNDQFVFEGNEVYAASHAPYWSEPTTDYSVIRNNIFSNKWRYGPTIRGNHTLLENNTYYNNGERNSYCPWHAPGCSPLSTDRDRQNSAIYVNCTAQHTIIRNEIGWDNDLGIFLCGRYGRVYNNTFYNTKQWTTNIQSGIAIYAEAYDGINISNNKLLNNIFWKIEGGDAPTYDREFRIYWLDTGTMDDNIVQNNIFADPTKLVNGTWRATSGTVEQLDGATIGAGNDWIGNFGLTTSDPEMTDPDNQDFSLQNGAYAMDKGIPLTYAYGNGDSSASLTVDDAYFFYDGWGIDGESADYICIGSVGPVQIKEWVGSTPGINYPANIITLVSQQSWGDNDPIYKAVSHTACFYGPAPDLGAIEGEGNPDSAPPTPNPATITSVTPLGPIPNMTVVADTPTDATPPIETNYIVNNTDCGANAGTGAATTGYLSATTSHNFASLQQNKCYGFQVQHRDSVGTPNVGTISAINSKYALAYLSHTPTFENATNSTVEILVVNANGNPESNPTTLYALQVTSTVPSDSDWIDKWVQANGSAGTGKVFLSKAAWEAVTITGLNEATAYQIKIKSQNGDLVESTNYGTAGEFTTTGEYEPSPPGTKMVGGTSEGGVQ